MPLWSEHPYCVLLENSDSESEAHARSQFERLLETAFEQGVVNDAVVAESLQQANALWHIRESIPLAQAEEGLNIKHDISIPVSKIPAFCTETDALLASEVPGVRLVNFGHLGDGNLHYNVQAPEGGDPKIFLREQEERVNHLVFDQVARFERLDQRRTRRRQPQDRQAAGLQGPGRAGADALHQAGAGPAEPDEPGPGRGAARRHSSHRKPSMKPPKPPLTLPQVPPLSMERGIDFVSPISWGVSDPARFSALMKEVLPLVAHGFHFADNLFTWGRNNSAMEDPSFNVAWRSNIQNKADQAHRLAPLHPGHQRLPLHPARGRLRGVRRQCRHWHQDRHGLPGRHRFS